MQVARADEMIEISAGLAAIAHCPSWHFSEKTNEASDFRLGEQSRLNAIVARTAAF